MKKFFLHCKITTLSLFFLSAMLTGCTSMPSMETLDFLSDKTPRSCTSNVDIRGRFSIRYKIDGREESLHGNFDWQQTTDYTVITLLSPLGQSMAKIEVTPQLTTFTAPGKAPKSATNAEELIRSELGWTLPVSGLRDWLQGCATDMQNHPFIATPQSRQVITREGWQIDYISWIDGPVMPLPKRIDLIKGGNNAIDVDIHLKLVIDEWQFPKSK